MDYTLLKDAILHAEGLGFSASQVEFADGQVEKMIDMLLPRMQDEGLTCAMIAEVYHATASENANG